MLADRNKSQATHDITDAAHRWLDNHGFKPVETEVYCGDTEMKGWVADLAGVISPTQTELIELRLIPRPPRYRYGKNESNDGYREKREAWDELRRTVHRTMTCLVEVKATRADFRGDRKWKIPAPTDLAYIAIPSGMIKREEWPEGWGILEMRGGVVCQVRVPTPRVATLKEHFTVVYNIAVRRDHRTRYERSREWMKQQRAEDALRVSIDRMDAIIQAVTDIAHGKNRWGAPITSVEDVLKYHRVRNMRDAQIKRLEAMLGIAAPKESVV